MGRLEEADRLVGAERIYDATGIQEMEINTMFQLMADRGTAAYGAASQLLLVPDLLAYFLTGERRFERTNASTTQLVDVRTGEVVEWVLPLLGLRTRLVRAGRPARGAGRAGVGGSGGQRRDQHTGIGGGRGFA